MGLVDLLLLTDGRAPLGAYAHSFGLEAAVIAGAVDDVDDLDRFIRARLATAGRVEAAAAAAVRHRTTPGREPADGLPAWLPESDREVDVRLLSPATRAASRALGRHLIRLARRTWPDPWLETMATGPDRPEGWHQPVVLGVVGAATGTSTHHVATASLYGVASGLASAGVRLLGLDPVAVHAVQATLAPTIDALAVEAADTAPRPLADLPASAAPLADIRAQQHAADPGGRLFAS